jgi:hypothetical protein
MMFLFPYNNFFKNQISYIIILSLEIFNTFHIRGFLMGNQLTFNCGFWGGSIVGFISLSIIINA